MKKREQRLWGAAARACADAHRHMKGDAGIWFVYAMATVMMDGVRFVKFGVSSRPVERLNVLQTGCPMKIERAFSVACATRRAAYCAENMFHRAFEDRLSSVEWFRFEAKDNEEFRLMVEGVLGKVFGKTWRVFHWRLGEPLENLGRFTRLMLADTPAMRTVVELVPRLALEPGKA